LNYLDHPIVGPYFGFFILVWIYMRHYLNLRILWSEFNEFKTVGPYELDWATEQYKCSISHYISTALLASLQCLNIFWLYFILRIAYRFIWFNVAKDDRSDDEETELAEERKLEKLSSQVSNGSAAPELMVNGKTLGVTTTGAQLNTNGSTNRKQAS
jgi:acyl-CoA-dependent ceramide synthase